MKQTILLTGALGLVGSEVLRRLLQWDEESQIVLLLRPKGPQSIESRFQNLWKGLFPNIPGAETLLSRVQLVEAELSTPRLGLCDKDYDLLARRVTSVLHIAADVRFDLTLAEARHANLDSTRELFYFAKEAARVGTFAHFHYVSTFATARRRGEKIIFEKPANPARSEGHRNTYEQSKAEAELFLSERASDIPVSIYRPSVICGDARNGWTTRTDPFHFIFKLFLGEVMHQVKHLPVPRDARMDVVSLDFVADALFLLSRDLQGRASGSIFHLVAGDQAISPARALRALSSQLATTLRDKGLPVAQMPEFVEIDQWNETSLNEFFGTTLPLGHELLQLLQRVLPYAFDTETYDNANFRRALPGSRVQPKSILENLPSLVEFFVQTEWQKNPVQRFPLGAAPKAHRAREGIAIIGLGGIFPQAKNVAEFWDNVVTEKDCLSDIVPERWDPAVFANHGPIPDQTSGKLAGVIQDIHFEEIRFRIPPLTAKTMDRTQKMVLLAAEEALRDAGYSDVDFPPNLAAETGIILGYSGVQVENDFIFSAHPNWALIRTKLLEAGLEDSVLSQLEKEMIGTNPAINEDTLAGSLANVAVGRVMNYFDLRGPSYVVNAGDSSALTAIDQAIDCLRTQECDLMIAGGVHALLDPPQWLGMAGEGRLSSARPQPFSPSADGTLPGEGVALFILKRLSDAVRDQDRIYAVIRAVGHAGNGKSELVNETAAETIKQSIRLALEMADSTPDRISHLEAHGSGIPTEDQNELRAIYALFPKSLELGTLKEQIGHLAGASGAAAMMKSTLALYHSTGRESPTPEGGKPKQYGISTQGLAQAYHIVLEEWDPGRFPEQLVITPTEKVVAEPIAVVALGATLPSAPNVKTFWELILSGQTAVQEMPAHFWLGAKSAFYDSDPQALNKTYGTLGAFAPTVNLDALALGIPHRILNQMDPVHRQFLAAATEALGSRVSEPINSGKNRTTLIVGESKSGSLSNWKLALQLSLRKLTRYLAKEKVEFIQQKINAYLAGDLGELQDLDEDSLANTLFPVALARFAKASDIQGGHCAIDAACASSFAALGVALRELRLNKKDSVIWGGVGVSVSPAANIPFARCHALSARGSDPFGENADGLVLGEGSAVFVLKRLSDAEKNHDPIHAVILGVGASSDGRGHSMMAPSSIGQALALERALIQANVTPASIQFVECHATGTSVGDESEIETVAAIYSPASDSARTRKIPLVIGSVKSLIGHTVGAAGAAGLLKTILGLEHRIFPPTVIRSAVTHPHLKLEARRLRINVQAETWPPNSEATCRRAGVSAFGFGGTNWHTIVQEYVELKNSTYSIKNNTSPPPKTTRLPQTKTAFLFPGHGSPYPDMGAAFYRKYPVFRAVFAEANETLGPLFGNSIEKLIFTTEGSSPGQIQTHLSRTDWVQPILLTVSLAFYRLVRDMGFKPDALLGHSVGEYGAAVAAGMMPFETALEILYQRGRIFREWQLRNEDTGRMAAVLCSATQANELLRTFSPESGYSEVVVASTNYPLQCVLSGASADLRRRAEYFEQNGITVIPLAIEVAWHSPLAQRLGESAFREVLESRLDKFSTLRPRIPAYSTITQEYYETGELLKAGLLKQIGSPMNFQAGVESLYASGVRTWLELGPRRLLKTFVSESLTGRPYQLHSIDHESYLQPEIWRELLAEVKIGKS
jgi:acyl transferase domain-containing protein/thioester reductase-like protein